MLENAIATGEAFSCYHRIIDVHGRVRSVLSVGHGVTGEDGGVERLTGFFVDMTELRRAETQAEVESALAVIARTRTVIDRAKGMLMLATDATVRRRSPCYVPIPRTRTSSSICSLSNSWRPASAPSLTIRWVTPP